MTTSTAKTKQKKKQEIQQKRQTSLEKEFCITKYICQFLSPFECTKSAAPQNKNQQTDSRKLFNQADFSVLSSPKEKRKSTKGCSKCDFNKSGFRNLPRNYVSLKTKGKVMIGNLASTFSFFGENRKLNELKLSCWTFFFFLQKK